MARCYEVLDADTRDGFVVRQKVVRAETAVEARRRAKAGSDATVREVACGLAGVASWRKRAPRLAGERRALLSRCGARAFLDPKGLRYPVVAARGGCKPDCQGIRAAFSRARQQHARKLAAKALRMACKARCAWTARPCPKPGARPASLKETT